MKKKILIAIIVFILAIIFLPYAYVEINTSLYGKQFATEYRQTGMIDSVEYYKIFSYSDKKAKVYYVDKDHTSGNYVWFEKNESEWKMTTWSTVWSEYGSASDITFPFYR